MKILILGGKGMAGHMITSYFKQKQDYNVFYTSKDINDKDGIYLDVTDSIKLEKIIDSIKPDVTINCIGILNENANNNPKLAFQINSLLPHQLVKLIERTNGKLIHISTDCVFLGTKGNYTENDIPDGTSIYARSKQLGEIVSDKHLTIRTSIIGPELKENGIGLFLWFISQQGTVKGYEKVYWNGVTTLELAKAIDMMIRNKVSGLYHLCSEKKISKNNLLRLIQSIFDKKDVEIVPNSEIFLDRSLTNTRTDFIYKVPPYDEMLIELKEWLDMQ